jgi:hypothetical protein
LGTKLPQSSEKSLYENHPKNQKILGNLRVTQSTNGKGPRLADPILLSLHAPASVDLEQSDDLALRIDIY